MENKTKPVKSVSQRRKNRMCALQFLYQWEINKSERLHDALRVFIESQSRDRDYYGFAEELIHGALENINRIDREIRSHTANWAFERIAKVDLAVLRLAIYELLYRNDIPPIVSINEAIELGKTFSDPESKRFINGILDQIKNKIRRPLRQATK